MLPASLQHAMEERIAEMVFADFDVLLEWLSSLGCEVKQKNEYEAAVHGLTGVTVGILAGADPIQRAVAVGMALFGTYWVYVVPSLLDEVNRKWSALRQNAPLANKGEPEQFAMELLSDDTTTNIK